VDERYDSFIVRVQVGTGGIVRGEVTHPASGSVIRFIDLDALKRFIEEQAGTGHLPGLEADRSR